MAKKVLILHDMASKEGVGLPIVLGRPNRPDLVVHTPLVLKGKAASFEGHRYKDTRNVITRTAGNEHGDNLNITTTFLHPVSGLFPSSPDVVTQRAVLIDGQSKQEAHLPGRGTIFVGIPK